jgi:hypothetical protein
VPCSERYGTSVPLIRSRRAGQLLGGGVEDGGPDPEHDFRLGAGQRVEALALGHRERTVEHLEHDAGRGIELLAAAEQHRGEWLERLLGAERNRLVHVHDPRR